MASSNQAASTRTQARNNTQAIVVTALAMFRYSLPLSSSARKPAHSAVLSAWDCSTCSPAGLHGLRSLS